jgi:CheY-like chemotaxis protein
LALLFNERHIPVEHFPALLGMAESEEDGEEDDPIERVIVVEDQGRLLGLTGGAIEEERELTLRPLGMFLRDIQIFIGTAILDYGEPALVVSVSELMRRAELGVVSVPGKAAHPTIERKVVLVEDSEIVRDMIEGMLRGLGHSVLEAANGRDALVHLECQDIDVVITDLEMPVMDGFELIKQIRANPSTSDVPVVVLSSRGSAEDKQRAGELGADAYLVKSEFSEERLVETLSRFLHPEGAER